MRKNNQVANAIAKLALLISSCSSASLAIIPSKIPTATANDNSGCSLVSSETNRTSHQKSDRVNASTVLANHPLE